MPTLRIHVLGEPIAKQRPRVTRARAYTPEKTHLQERLIADEWATRHRTRVPPNKPFEMAIVALYGRPRTHLQSNGDIKPSKRNHIPGPRTDIDNVAKLVLDALNGVAYDDDRYCTTLIASKTWAPPGLAATHIEITYQ
jgi:Holliday junction resolvase RusA-like endonuclease